MPVLAEISVTPVGKEGASLGDTVVETLKVAEARGVNYQVGPLGTSLEGDLGTLLEVLQEMHEACFRLGYPRVITSLRIDDRRDKDLTMNYRVESVKRKLAEQATHIRES
jgi:uncharacterized protein (TIGR00106 family)